MTIYVGGKASSLNEGFLHFSGKERVPLVRDLQA